MPPLNQRFQFLFFFSQSLCRDHNKPGRFLSVFLVGCLGVSTGAAQSPSAVPLDNSTTTDPPLAQPIATESTKMTYPETKTVDVTDDYHGRIVNDPYRWLEDVESEETEAWVTAQNKVTRAYLDSIPQREDLRTKLEQLWNYERYGLPASRGSVYFYSHNDGLQDQSLLYKAGSLNAERKVLIDPNTLSEDGTVALSSWVPTDDGRLLAYGLADGGSDWRTWKVRDVTTGEDLDDVVRWVKFSGIAWMPDNSGFFYSRYDEPAEGEELTGTNENQKMYFHQLGTDQNEDPLVFSRPDHPQWGFEPEVTEDGRYLIISNWRSTEPTSQTFIKDLTDPSSTVQPLITGFDAEYGWVASQGTTLYFITDHEAAKRRLIAVDVENSGRDQWVEVIPEDNDVLESVSLFGETFYANYLRDARARVSRFTVEGEPLGDLELPDVGAVTGLGGKQDATETFFSFTNYVTPTSIYRIDLTTGEYKIWRSPDVAFEVDDFVTEQVFVTSKDGTRVPMIITRHQESELDGSHRTLLYAYGGFNISLPPSYSPAVAGWLDAGGIYAVANLRGGGEYGREWHEAGMLEKKQNVFDDFFAAAEYLIEQGYTTSSRLGIRGGSNGGLLVGAALTQRPELFGACLPAVGVMDMLRYHKFTIGWAWASEYGSSDDEEHIDNLLSYSPLHNLKVGTCYPATMVTTADRDDRVVPGHSFKFAAALQAAQGCDQPALIRIETRAGHGAGTPVSKRIDEYADLWAFLFANLR